MSDFKYRTLQPLGQTNEKIMAYQVRHFSYTGYPKIRDWETGITAALQASQALPWEAIASPLEFPPASAPPTIPTTLLQAAAFIKQTQQLC